MAHIKVFHSEIHTGKPLPWPIFDKGGRMLLNTGETIATNDALEALLKRGVYRKSQDGSIEEAAGASFEEKTNPFDYLDEFAKRLLPIYVQLERANGDFFDRTLHLSDAIQEFCANEPDVALASLHLFYTPNYSLIHPVHSAMICELVGQAAQWDPHRRRSLVAAALTCDVAMRELLDRLHTQKEPLSAALSNAVQAHPSAAAALLRQAGVTDAVWLQAVEQHHERLDGSGYLGLSDAAIGAEARLLGIADRYGAMVSPRHYKPVYHGHDALRELLLNVDKRYDPELCVLTIKTFGIYPPGRFVKLISGEIAMVTKRGKDNPLQPIVASLKGLRGTPYVSPMRRDCSEKAHAIKEACKYDGVHTLNLASIWAPHRH